VPCASGSGDKPLVVVYLAGVARRLLLNSTLEHMARPLRNAGFDVHFYLSLVVNGEGIGNNLKVRNAGVADPSLGLDHPGDLRSLLERRIARAGACPVCLELLAQAEELGDVPHRSYMLEQYPPARTAAGKRILALWMARERLWNYTLQIEAGIGRRYALAVWQRDDTHWLGDITDASALLASSKGVPRAWSSDWGFENGRNDKVFIMERAAAPVLLTLYSAYMRPALVRPSPPSAIGVNPEKVICSTAQCGSIETPLLNFRELPVSVAQLMPSNHSGKTQVSLCVLYRYWSGEKLADWTNSTDFCENLATSGR